MNSEFLETFRNDLEGFRIMISSKKTPSNAPGNAFPSSPASVAMFFEGNAELPTKSAIFGATVATYTFYQALLRNGRVPTYELFAGPGQEAFASNQVSGWLADGASVPRMVRIHSYQDLFNRFDDFPFTVWHDPSANFPPLFHVRRALTNRLYPITFTHYTLSYQSYLHDFLLPLLLADTYPCDSIACTSVDAKNALQHLIGHVSEDFERRHGVKLCYNGRFDLLPIGVDTDLFRPRDKADARHQLELPTDAFILLWFGRFSFADKMDLLPMLRVFADLLKRNPTRKLLFVLGGTERPGYAAAVQNYAQALGIADRVRVLLNFPAKSRHLLFAAADLFVSPCDNVQETFGITPIEAMACGVPQVVSDWDGYKDTVAHDETGFLVPTYWARCDGDLRAASALVPFEADHLALAQSVVVDNAAYAQYLQRLIENDGLRQTMAEASRERALSRFSWPVVVGQYEALWAELAALAPTLIYEPKDRTDYTHMPYFDAFRTYPTGLLPEETPIRLTASGTRLLRGKEPLPSYPGFSETLDESLLHQALQAVKINRLFHRSYRWSALAEDLADSKRVEEDRARRHVLWLLKYGYIEPIRDLSALRDG
jgi:glycosyltransferase involved in cell wall biosynthesis